MKFPVHFFCIGILIFVFTGCNEQSLTISPFEDVELSNDLFSWQQEEYCPFEGILLTSEIRCSFDFRVYTDGMPPDPYWYIRHYDKEITDDIKAASGMHLVMDSTRSRTFPSSNEEFEKFLTDNAQFYAVKPEYSSLTIDGKKAWKIMQYSDGDISLPSGEEWHSSGVIGEYILEKDDQSIYVITVLLMSDSPEKIVAYQAEVDHFMSSIQWK